MRIFLPVLLCLCTVLTIRAQYSERIVLRLKKTVACDVPGRNSETDTKLRRIHDRFRARGIRKISLPGSQSGLLYSIALPRGTNVHGAIAEYYKTGLVEYAEPDYAGSGDSFTPNDRHYAKQWPLRNQGNFPLAPSVPGADINMEPAWALEQGDSSIIVGIIDSGIKADHPEFRGRLWTNSAEIPGNGLDDDNNGYADDIHGWDFVNNDNHPADDNGHGTCVAGIIGANGNDSTGFAGIDWKCRLMIIKATDQNTQGLHSWWAAAIYYAVDNGARVINMSGSSFNTSATLRNAVDYALQKGVVFVTSMANQNSSTLRYPAAYPGVIAVGATNPDDRRAHPFFWDAGSGSNYGSHISVVAPGNYIYGLHHLSNSNYGVFWGGTSFAAPHVAGIASLILARNPLRPAAEIKSIIERSADDLVGDPKEDIPGWDQYYGYGRVNAFRALSLAIGVRIVSQPQSHTVCEGDSAIVLRVAAEAVEGSNAAISYQWQKNGTALSDGGRISGSTTGMLRIAEPVPADAGTYSVLVSAGSPDKPLLTQEAVLTVRPLPAIIAEPSPVWLCKGESRTLTVGATGDSLFYQWQKDGRNIPGANSSSLTVSDEGIYQALVGSYCRTIASHSVGVRVLTPPIISEQPISSTLCEGGVHRLRVIATGPELLYQWRKNGLDIPGANSPELLTGEEGDYYASIRNFCGSVLSSTARINILPRPAILVQPSSAVVCEGQPYRLNVVAAGSSLRYQWQKDGRDIPGAEQAAYTPVLPGEYRVRITGACNEIISQAAAVRITESPNISRDPAAGNYCTGELLSVTASGSELEYQWRKDGQDIPGATNPTFAVTGSGSYSVFVRNSCSGMLSRPAMVEIGKLPEILSGPLPATLDRGSALVLNVSAVNADSYQWMLNGIPIPGAKGAAYSKDKVSQADAGLYSVRIGNKCGELVSGEARVDIVTDIDEEYADGGPFIGEARPNPFSDKSRVEFFLPKPTYLTVVLSDALGRSLAVFMDGNIDAGSHTLTIDAAGHNLPAGSYFLSFRSPDFSFIRRISLIP